VTSPLRIAGNAISGVTICILGSLGVFLLVTRWREKHRTKNDPTPMQSPLA
jgi:hypothetical protein